MLRGLHLSTARDSNVRRSRIFFTYFITNGLPGKARPHRWVIRRGHLLVPIKDTLVDTQLKRCLCVKLVKDNEPFPTHDQQSGGRRAWIERRAKVALRPATAM